MRRTIGSALLLTLVILPSLAKAPDTVYITKSGKKYHAAGCRYLKKSAIAVDLAEAKRNRYSPCSVFHP